MKIFESEKLPEPKSMLEVNTFGERGREGEREGKEKRRATLLYLHCRLLLRPTT